MTSRLLGVVREQVLAYYFGAGNAMDAYNVAFRFPNLLRDLFAEGAMSGAFVPTFASELTTNGKERAFRLANYVVNALLIVTGVAVVLGMVFAEPLVRAFAGGFEDVPGKLELTVLLTRIMLPFLTFVALAAAFMGMANALHHFFVPAVSPAMFNVSSVVCTVGLIAVMPAFAGGGLSLVNDALDVVVAILMVGLVGWHFAFLPSFVAELVPGLDLVPTWTLAVWFVTRKGAIERSGPGPPDAGAIQG